MYKSSNMLRTRRRDNNVKPNRRLDRKSSRGMIYENEELRLKTININAEIERGQSDIKKLKRENEMLKKEIWCLRDEYDKLDKLLKDKIDLSSSSTTGSSTSGSSDSDSCSSCSEEEDGEGGDNDGGAGEGGRAEEEEEEEERWREVETAQNRDNVQKTDRLLRRLREGGDQLSVVLEEPPTSASPASDPHRSPQRLPSPATGPVLTPTTNAGHLVLKADQSYPSCETLQRAATLPMQQSSTAGNFFAPIRPTYGCEDDPAHFEQRELPLYPEQLYQPSAYPHHPSSRSLPRLPHQSPAATTPADFYANRQQATPIDFYAANRQQATPIDFYVSQQQQQAPPYQNGGDVEPADHAHYYTDVTTTPPQTGNVENVGGTTTEYYTTEKLVDTTATTFYQNMVLVPKHHNGPVARTGDGARLQGMAKTSTDLLVKLDERGLSGTPQSGAPPPPPPRSTFSNGGNLEELLHDIESISRDILHISTAQNCPVSSSAAAAVANAGDFISRMEAADDGDDAAAPTYLQNPELAELEHDQACFLQQQRQTTTTRVVGYNAGERPYRSELSVTLVPSPMALLGGADRYRRLDAAVAHSRSLDDLNSGAGATAAMKPPALYFQQSDGRACSLVESPTSEYRQGIGAAALPHEEDRLQQQMGGGPGAFAQSHPQFLTPPAQRRAGVRACSPIPPTTAPIAGHAPHHPEGGNPFFFGKLTDELFSRRYNPDNYLRIDQPADRPHPSPTPSPQPQRRRPAHPRSPLPDHSSSSPSTAAAIVQPGGVKENIEDLRFGTSKPQDVGAPTTLGGKDVGGGGGGSTTNSQTGGEEPQKQTKGLGIRRKVSIHFKGRAKDKAATTGGGGGGNKTPGGGGGEGMGGEKKHPLFDVKFSSSSEGGGGGGKGGGGGAKVNSSAESSAAEPKTPSGSDSATTRVARGGRKSASASPERSQHNGQQHVVKGDKKGHGKKHKKSTASASRVRRNTAISVERLPVRRERSFSVCTDRSNLPGVGFMGGGAYGYDSDRDDSLSSCDTGSKTRKMSSLSSIPLTGKVPWCGCWGNGCL